MTGQATVELAIMQQLLRRHRSLEDAQQVLGRDAVPGLIVEDGHDGCAIGDESTNDHHLGDRVVRSPGMPGQALRPGERREEYDRVTAQLDVVLERGSLLIRQAPGGGVQLQGSKRIQVDGKGFVGHRPAIRKFRKLRIAL